jgi:alkyl hydroperoxide reductase 1
MLQLFLSDTKTFFSKEYGWPAGMGDRNGRWAMIFDDGKVIYAENEKSPGEVSVIPNQLSYSGNNPLFIY